MRKNTEIELLRFIFALGVMLYHFNIDYSLGLGFHGYLGVEFFFVVAGFFMAKNAFENENNESVGILTGNYILHKVKKIYVFYLVALLISVVYYMEICKWDTKDIFMGLLDSLPSYVFVDMTVYGFGGSITVGNQWFLSALFLCQLILYPIALKKKETAVCIIFPLIGIFGLGFMYRQFQCISPVSAEGLIVYPGIIRAMAEISLGGMLYPIVGNAQNIKFTKFAKCLLSTVKYLLLAVIVTFIIGNYDNDLDIGVFILLLIFVALTLCDNIYKVKGAFFRLLGSWSISIFLFHMPVKLYLLNFFGTGLQPTQNVFVFFADLIVCILLHYVANGIIFALSWLKELFVADDSEKAR